MRRRVGAFLGWVLVAGGCATGGATAREAGMNGPRVIDAAAMTRIDSTLRSFTESGRLAGVSALVFEKGREVYFGAYGTADREKQVPMDRNIIVQIFSMTKPVTGVALMTLYEKGAFQLDDPVAKYAPEFANVKVYAGADANGSPILQTPARPITIRDLTRHTAGFATGADNPGVGPNGQPLAPPGEKKRIPLDVLLN